MQEVLRFVSTAQSVTTAYNLQTNGLAERLKHTLADMIAIYVSEDHTNLDAVLPYVTFTYITARQVTSEFSPYFLRYAHEPPIILDAVLPYMDDSSLSDFTADVVCRTEEARQLSRLRTLKSQQDQQLPYNNAHNDVQYQIGDEILFTRHRSTSLVRLNYF